MDASARTAAQRPAFGAFHARVRVVRPHVRLGGERPQGVLRGDKAARCSWRRAAVFALVCLSASSGSLRAEKLVAVRSNVDPDYATKRAAAPDKLESYVFAEGRYFSGVTYDSGLRTMPFLTIARTLAVDLKRQKYVPAPDLKAADLVIVVHWGATMPNDRGADVLALDASSVSNAAAASDSARNLRDNGTASDREQAFGNGAGLGTMGTLGTVEAADTTLRFESLVAGNVYRGNDLKTASNAEILGFTAALARESGGLFESARGETLRAMVEEERYFIVLMAFDAPALLEGKKRRLWTARLSIRSAGVNFAMAVDRMSGTGGNFFGVPQSALSLEPTQDRKGVVEIGELKVIGAVAPDKPRRR